MYRMRIIYRIKENQQCDNSDPPKQDKTWWWLQHCHVSQSSISQLSEIVGMMQTANVSVLCIHYHQMSTHHPRLHSVYNYGCASPVFWQFYEFLMCHVIIFPGFASVLWSQPYWSMIQCSMWVDPLHLRLLYPVIVRTKCIVIEQCYWASYTVSYVSLS